MSLSSRPSAAPLHLVLERSRGWQRAVVAVHALALIAALTNPLPGGIQALLAGAVIVSGGLTWRRQDSVRGLTLTPDEDWEVIGRDGSTLARLAPSSIVTSWIVILHLTAAHCHIAIPICRDGVDPESFRRLRVYLHIAGHRASNAEAA